MARMMSVQDAADLGRLKEGLHQKTALVELNSPRLFAFARDCYLREGRGAIFFFFKTRRDVFNVTDDTPYRYVDLCRLVAFRDQQVCDLARKYSVNECFVLLLAGSPHDDPESSFDSIFFYSKIVNPSSDYAHMHQEVAKNLLAKCGILQAGGGSTCVSCWKLPGTMQCARCKRVRYCSVTCQRMHWAAHKQACHK